MAEILRLMQEVQQVVRRCPEPTLVAAYVRAARQFCRETRWLRRNLEIPTVQGVNEYALAPTTGDDAQLEVIGIRAAIGQSTTDPVQTWPINPGDPTMWNPSIQEGYPVEYAYMPEARVAVWNVPDARPYLMTSTVTVQPKLEYADYPMTYLPDDLVRKWDRVFSAGAIEYLMSIPGQPWSNLEAARKVYAPQFRAGINDGRNDEQRAYNAGSTMGRIRRLF